MNVDSETKQDDAAEGFVDALLRSASESATRTAEGIDEMGGQVCELGGAVAKLAGVVERMAGAVSRTRAHADETRHAVGAAEWFWRKVKAVLSANRKALVGGAVAVCLGLGVGPAGGGKPPSIDGKADVAGDVHSAMVGGRWADADRILAGRGHAMPDADRLWMRAQVRRAMGDETTADHLLALAAGAGSRQAKSFLIRGRG